MGGSEPGAPVTFPGVLGSDGSTLSISMRGAAASVSPRLSGSPSTLATGSSAAIGGPIAMARWKMAASIPARCDMGKNPS